MDDLDLPSTSTSSRSCRRFASNVLTDPVNSVTNSLDNDQLADSNQLPDSGCEVSIDTTRAGSTRKRRHNNGQRSAEGQRGTKRSQTELMTQLTITCLICGERVSGTETFVNTHVDECVEHKEFTENNELQEYEWAGQSKYRTTFEEAKIFAGSTLVQVTYDDNDNVVDVEDDFSIYGPPQYNEKRVASINRVSSSTSCSPPSPQPSTSASSTEDNEGQATSSSSSSDQLTVESLKERVKQLERSEGAKCSVCLDVLRDPVVSIICWHVYCEECWLKSLKMKKLCPRCTAITTPSDLRRIYL